ncbi:MAG TPA: WbqC family protein [Bacteroidia bacterium]
MIVPLLLLPPSEYYASIYDLDVIQFPDYLPMPDEPGFNRLEFGGHQGKMTFSIPLLASTRKGPYAQVEISYATNWHNQLINALKTAYGKSPFFEYYDYQIEKILRKKLTHLMALNLELMQWSLKALKMETRIEMVPHVPFELQNKDQLNSVYHQVFASEIGFVKGLSILDLIFNEGIDATTFLEKIKR